MTPTAEFAQAARSTVAFLAGQLGPATVFVARVEDADLVIVEAAGGDLAGGDLAAGAELRWPGAMDGPDAGDARGSPLWVAGRDRPLAVRAYVRAPVRGADGTPYALLAAVDDGVPGPDLGDALSLLELLAALLGRLVALDLDLAEEERRAERAEADALFDALTGVGNRRHWARLLEAEDSRCRRHGTPASVIVLDLDGVKEVNDRHGHEVGDELLRRAATVLHDVCRGHDLVARLGGDEFAVLAVDCGHDDCRALAVRLQAALERAGIAASVGFAGRHPAGGLEHAWRRADRAMYEMKRGRKAGRSSFDLTRTERTA